MGIWAKNGFQKKRFAATSSRKLVHISISNNKRPSEKVQVIDALVIKEENVLN